MITMITSQVSGLSFPADTPIREYSAAGLTIDETLVRRRIGRLAPVDQGNVAKQFANLYKAVMRP